MTKTKNYQRKLIPHFQLGHLSFLWFFFYFILWTFQNSKNIYLERNQVNFEDLQMVFTQVCEKFARLVSFLSNIHYYQKNKKQQKQKPPNQKIPQTLNFCVSFQESSIRVCSVWQHSTFIFFLHVIETFSTILMIWLTSTLLIMGFNTYYLCFFYIWGQ